MSSRLVFVTQQVDPEHPVLGAVVAKIRALAARVDAVDVLALRAVPGALPPSCRVRTFGAPSQALRGVRYLAALGPALARRPAALLAHMSPIYARLAAPFAHRLSVPVLLWYTQQTSNPLLERTAKIVDGILTADRHSFPVPSPKVRPIGQGIDLAAFRCREAHGGMRLLGLGRYAPVKRWDLVMRALVEVPEAELLLHGALATETDRRHRPELERLAAELGVAGRVRFGEAVPYSQVPRLLGEVDALVNATRGGAADKVVYEACAACVPVFAASPAFEDLLPPELRFEDEASLVERLRAFRDADGGRVALGRSLRERVAAEHSAEHWADAVLEAIAETARAAR